jgi:hypothetical protein
MIELVGPVIGFPLFPMVLVVVVLGDVNFLNKFVPTYNVFPLFESTTGATNAAYSVGVLVTVFVALFHVAPPNPPRPVLDLYQVP